MSVSSDHSRWWLLVFPLMLSIIAGMTVLAQRLMDIPAHGEPCDACHLGGSRTTRASAHMLAAPQETLCAQCHVNAMTASHPSGFTPKRILPNTFPLDWKGDVTCSSCHDLHARRPGLLRTSDAGRAFCVHCHDETLFQQMADAGASVQLSGHLGRDWDDLDTVLDPFSRECLECHEAQMDPLRQDDVGLLRHAGGRMNHPVGVRYADAELFGGYRPVELLSREISLSGGRIACISCHQGYAAEHGKVVTVDSGRGLCAECHDL